MAARKTASMRQWLRRRASARRRSVEICETCGTACDAGCRARAARDRARDQAVRAVLER